MNEKTKAKIKAAVVAVVYSVVWTLGALPSTQAAPAHGSSGDYGYPVDTVAPTTTPTPTPMPTIGNPIVIVMVTVMANEPEVGEVPYEGFSHEAPVVSQANVWRNREYTLQLAMDFHPLGGVLGNQFPLCLPE